MNLIERLREASQDTTVLEYGEHWNLHDEAATALEQANALLQEVLAADDEGGKWFNAWQTLEWRIRAYLAEPADTNTTCCCYMHHRNYGRCLQCPVHSLRPPQESRDA